MALGGGFDWVLCSPSFFRRWAAASRLSMLDAVRCSGPVVFDADVERARRVEGASHTESAGLGGGLEERGEVLGA